MREGEQKLLAVATLVAGLGTAVGIVLTAKGRVADVYPVATAVAVSTAIVYSAYALGGDQPRRVRI